MRYFLTQEQLMELLWLARKLDSLALMEKLQVVQAQKLEPKP